MLSLDDFRVEESLKWEVMEQTDRVNRHRQLFHELFRDYTEYDDPRLLDGIYRALDAQVGRHLREASARLHHARYQLDVLRRRREAGQTVASMPPTEHKTISPGMEYPRLIPWGHDAKVVVVEPLLTDVLVPVPNVELASDDEELARTEGDEGAERECEQDPILVWESTPATTLTESQTETEAPIASVGVAESAPVNAPEFDEVARIEVVRPALPPFQGNEQNEPSVLATDSGFLFSDSDVSAIDFESIRTEPMQSIPLGTPGTPEEAAELVSFLAKHKRWEVRDENQTDRERELRTRGNGTNGTACGPPLARAGKQDKPTYH